MKLWKYSGTLLSVTGVIHIISFDSMKFDVVTTEGILKIKGTEIALVRYDEMNKEISINGKIESLEYSE